MSMRLFRPLPAECSTEDRRRFWAWMFGEFIRSAREKRAIPVEEAARLSGMGVTEWQAVESGQEVPRTQDQLSRMAGALGLSLEALADLVLLCQEAWSV